MSSTQSAKGGFLGKNLYVQVLLAIVAGIGVGYFFPTLGSDLRFLSDAFIRLIRMLLGPIIFGTVVVGIARMGNLREVGRVGIKSLLYFEVVSSLALAIGLIVVNLLQPGRGMNVDPLTLDPHPIEQYTAAAAQAKGGIIEFLLNVIPTSVVEAFSRGDILQIIFFAVLLGVVMSRFREQTQPLLGVIDSALHAFFAIIGVIMKLAPIGAFGAMAFTIGKYGIATLLPLGRLMVAVYLTCFLFIVVVLGGIAAFTGFNLWKFLRFIREEILVVFATCSTEAVLPRMMEKLEKLGCAKPIVGMVLPAGYTFNPDGTAIYLTMAAIFIAQATNTSLSLLDQLTILGVLLFTSKGSAGVAGAGFVTLAATLGRMNHIPVAGLVLLLGVDRFLNEARAVTNLIGNGVATMAIARWEGALDLKRTSALLNDEAASGETGR